MLLALLTLCTTSQASGLSTPRSGLVFDLAGGGAIAGAPASPAIGSIASVGVWFGPYDDAYAVGRYTSIGLTGRSDWVPLASGSQTTVAPLLELRRGMDLIVVGPWVALLGGPVLDVAGGDPLWTTRLAAGAEFRRHRFWGLTARLEGGTTFGRGPVQASAALMLGVQFSRPWTQERLN